MLKSILITGIGGFIGTALRYLTSVYFQAHSQSTFPWSTFTVNMAGSLLIGIIYGFSERGNLLSAEWRLFLAVGICGGFTTFSSLANDTFLLMQGREWFRMAIYTSASFFLGLLAVILGRFLVKLV